jgi:hypothetical protein
MAHCRQTNHYLMSLLAVLYSRINYIIIFIILIFYFIIIIIYFISFYISNEDLGVGQRGLFLAQRFERLRGQLKWPKNELSLIGTAI